MWMLKLPAASNICECCPLCLLSVNRPKSLHVPAEGFSGAAANTTTNDSTNKRKATDEDACNHDDVSNYKLEDLPAYFSTHYLKENTNMASRCAKCQKDLVDKIRTKDVAEMCYKVSGQNTVMLCINAAKPSHSCDFAYCQPCYLKVSESTSGSTKRRRRARCAANSVNMAEVGQQASV